jgi:hypothetical protein
LQVAPDGARSGELASNLRVVLRPRTDHVDRGIPAVGVHGFERIEQPPDRILDAVGRESCSVGLHLAGRAHPLPLVNPHCP